MKVHDAAGTSLGEVKDVIVDTDRGRVQYAVLSFGGVLGVGDKLFAIPPARLRQDAQGKLLLDVSKEQLKSAPAFESSRWPNWNDRAYRAEVDRRSGAKPGETTAHFRRGTDVIKARVVDSQGGNIGKVKDMIVDWQATRVASVVVDFDRAWNPNDKLVAVSMSAFSDGATAARDGTASAAGPSRNAPPAMALTNPSGEPAKGPASAVTGPTATQTTPPAVEPGPGADVQRLERQPKKTMTSYASDESLVFKGTREQLSQAPEFDLKRYSH